MKQRVKIIGGRFKGKQITFLDHTALRPTPQRVRETLFNWLMHDIRGADCLDAFAGSGALGFEAFSRGANKVYLLEQNLKIFKHIKNVAHGFSSNQLIVNCIDALHFLKKTKNEFHIIFLDPPFYSTLVQDCIAILEEKNILKVGGVLYTESASELELNNHIWQLLKKKKAGQVIYNLYRKKS